jgi:hypothetical protein
LSDLSTQNIVVVVLQLLIPVVIPGARITIQQRRSLNQLLSIFAPFTLECVVRLTERRLLEFEELAESIDREVAFDVFLFVYDTR